MTLMRLALAVAALTLAACGRHTGQLHISAAASLQNPLREIESLWVRVGADASLQSEPAPALVFNFGGSGTLAQQIEQGAPADVFISAGAKPMNRVAARLVPETRRNLLTNEIVLIVPKERPRVANFRDLANPQIVLIALGDPASVPAGDYGQQTLATLGLWETVRPKLVLAKDVRQVLTYVETGNADAGIVYATDARESPGVQVVETAPAGTHEPVVYPGAVVKGSRGNLDPAVSFLHFLSSPEARAIFERHGFRTIPQ